jgi:hypothetical protein
MTPCAFVHFIVQTGIVDRFPLFGDRMRNRDRRLLFKAITLGFGITFGGLAAVLLVIALLMKAQ